MFDPYIITIDVEASSVWRHVLAGIFRYFAFLFIRKQKIKQTEKRRGKIYGMGVGEEEPIKKLTQTRQHDL